MSVEFCGHCEKLADAAITHDDGTPYCQSCLDSVTNAVDLVNDLAKDGARPHPDEIAILQDTKLLKAFANAEGDGTATESRSE